MKGLASGYPSPTLSVDDTVVTWCSTRVNPVQALLSSSHHSQANPHEGTSNEHQGNTTLCRRRARQPRSILIRIRRQICVLTAGNAAEGLTILEENEIDILLSDERMPGMSGVEFLALAWERWPDVGRFIVSAYSDADRILRAINFGHAHEYILKPWDPNQILASLERRLDSQQQRKSLIRKAHILEDSRQHQHQVMNLYQLDCTAACNTSLKILRQYRRAVPRS